MLANNYVKFYKKLFIKNKHIFVKKFQCFVGGVKLVFYFSNIFDFSKPVFKPSEHSVTMKYLYVAALLAGSVACSNFKTESASTEAEVP